MPQPVNPCARPAATVATATAARERENGAPQVNVGPQSQRRLTQKERTHQLQSQSHRSKKQKITGQQTLFGDRAFDSLKDCEVCRAKQYGRSVHRAHHKLCNNKRGGAKATSTLALEQEEKRLSALFAAPLKESEKCSGRHMTQEAVQAYFTPREPPVVTTKITATTTTTFSMEATSVSAVLTPECLCGSVAKMLKDPSYAEFHNGRAPAAMLAFAKIVVEEIINKKKIDIFSHFEGLTMTVPSSSDQHDNPHYHSIVGQKLLNVDWKRMHGLDITCPRCQRCCLKNDRTNYSKNKILFPIFGLDGAPQWAMVQSMTCSCCNARIPANSDEILCKLPAYARNTYPVESKYALENKNSHLAKSVTNVMDLLMPTYGNGDLISRLLYNAINRSYLERVEAYYSFHKTRKEGADLAACVEKDGGYIRAYPPLGDGIRSTYDRASSNQLTPWQISDHDRHTREIQGVRCGLIFAQDHTHEVTKNYFQKKQLSAVAMWDVSTETGEIATAVLVPSTRTEHFSHAAAALTRREAFKPKAMYSDTWPCKSDFWALLFKATIEGRLGLFHYIQRLTKTMKKNHIDHLLAVHLLLNCIYHYNVEDHENLLRAQRRNPVNKAFGGRDTRTPRNQGFPSKI